METQQADNPNILKGADLTYARIAEEIRKRYRGNSSEPYTRVSLGLKGRAPEICVSVSEDDIIMCNFVDPLSLKGVTFMEFMDGVIPDNAK